ncbi:MAG: sigma-70 family RNA polymerase sigma factor [Nitriliruptorales bacterium]|nr:sigma-70 family RNA polymerase sigma factor [Nitriliruptorales bacterium]
MTQPGSPGAGGDRPLRAIPVSGAPLAAQELLARVAKGDQQAFADLFDLVGGQVYGLVRRVLRDPSISEEVAQEVLLEVWRTAARFDPERGSVSAWIMTMAHRRAVDRVRSEQASRDRDERVGTREQPGLFDEVVEEVEARLEQRQVRDALGQLTDLQREAVWLAYYSGYTHREVADLLDTPLGTVKTRIRDGLIRLRDTMGVNR